MRTFPKINRKAVLLARLSKDDLECLASFDCGDEEMNNFLKNDAFEQQDEGMSRTILLYYTGKLAAFCSVCADSLRLDDEEQRTEKIPLSVVPALKIARLGRDVTLKDFELGAYLVEYIKDYALDLSTSLLGIMFVTVDAYPGRVDYYRELEFMVNEVYVRDKRRVNISMRADLYSDDDEEFQAQEVVSK